MIGENSCIQNYDLKIHDFKNKEHSGKKIGKLMIQENVALHN